MNMQSDNASTAFTGLNFKEPRIDPAVRKAELEAVVSLANTRRRGLKRLGTFSIAPTRLDDDENQFTQIRAVPVTGLKGCEFRFNMPKSHVDGHDVEKVVERLLKQAAGFCRLRDLKKYIDRVMAVITKEIAPTAECLSPMRLIAIGMEVDVANKTTSLVADLERLGRNLKPGIDRITGWDIAEFEKKLAKSVAKHVERDKLRTAAAASRAIGWIDDAAVNILDASGMSRSHGLALLREQEFTEFYFGGDEGFDHFASLYWEDGVIRGDMDGSANDWRFSGDHLTMLNPGLPETVLAAWPGRRFGDVLENRFIPADAIVTRVQTSGEWVYVDMVIGNRLVDEASGQPRADRIV